jgi:hypothetical protein
MPFGPDDGMTPPREVETEYREVLAMDLFAWVGPDEFEIGLKQGVLPVGLVPLVAINRNNIDRELLHAQLRAQAALGGRTIYLVRFRAAEIIQRIEPISFQWTTI